MDITEFWKLIDKTREAANGDAQKQSDLLIQELAKLPEKEIISFDQIFDDLKDKAYIGNLWDAATIIMYGCSDSGFEVFREWLVGRGKGAFENAIKDPESLVAVLEVGEQIYPTLLGVTFNAYERATGKNILPGHRKWAELQGRPAIDLDADEAELLAEISTRFPKLTAKYWEWWTRDKIYIEVREILREVLLARGFTEKEMTGLGTVNFQRNPLLVKWVIDYYVPDYTVYVSSVARERKYPPAILMYFSPQEYSDQMQSAVRMILQGWLTIVERQ